jgi:hypothetical protein
VSKTFSTVFRERPPPARCATKPCTTFVVISGRWRLPNFGMMCARRCDSAARVVLPFRLTATLVRHSTNKLRECQTRSRRQLLCSIVHQIQVRLKLFPGTTFRLLVYESEKLPALLSLDCPVFLSDIRTIHAVPSPGLLNQTTPLKPSSRHGDSCARRRRRYRRGVYHTGFKSRLIADHFHSQSLAVGAPGLRSGGKRVRFKGLWGE